MTQFETRNKYPRQCMLRKISVSADEPDTSKLLAVDEIYRKNHNCIILLGEQGIGKSTAFEQMIDLTKQDINPDEDYCLPFNLRKFGSEETINKEIFESRDFKTWQNGDGRLFLFLDALEPV